MILTMLLLFVLLPVVFFTWTLIHEMSHVLMAKALLKVTEWKLIPYPHIHERDGKRYFVWALSLWKYEGEVTPPKAAAIYLAPRIPNLLAAILLQMYWLMNPGYLTLALVAFCVGGLVDLAVGSIGSGEFSDLMRSSNALGVSPWIFRVIGWVLVLSGLPVVISQIIHLL